MTALWTEQVPRYHGRYVSFDHLDAHPRPVRPGGRPIIAGDPVTVTPDAARRYAELGVDRLLLYPLPLDDPADVLRFVERHADLPR
jgi:alkanesulfonate monooxygenase SsuD/methylene tetrahydromethanopterin reductase-like flavin-dependent oxidoreductase (luciferase family)